MKHDDYAGTYAPPDTQTSSLMSRPMSFYVRAKYDFRSNEANLLSFQAGTLIEVLGQLESGWWDGLLDHNTRGWFPSNYVDIISHESGMIQFSHASICPKSPMLSISSGSTESTGSSGCDPNSGNNAMFHVNAFVQELQQLIQASQVPLSEHWAQTSRQQAVPTLKNGMTELAQTMHEIDEIVTQISKMDLEASSSHSGSSLSNVVLTNLPKNLSSQLPVLGVRVHMLLKYLQESTQIHIAHSEYAKEQIHFEKLAMNFIESLELLGQELRDDQRFVPYVRVESPELMEERSFEHAHNSDAADSSSLSASIPKIGALVKYPSFGRSSASEIMSALKRFSPANGSDGKSEYSMSSSSTTNSRVPLVGTLLSSTNSMTGSEISPGDIVFTDSGTVKGGTLEALVIQLTRHDAFDTKYTSTFMITYRSFTTSSRLMELLIDRFHLEIPSDLEESKFQQWEELKRTPVQLRAVNVMRLWLEYFCDTDDEKALDLVEAFANNALIYRHVSGMRGMLMRLIRRCRQGSGNLNRKMMQPKMQPKPLLPPSLSQLCFLNISPIELARQLTLMESETFLRIYVPECVNKAWASSDARHRASGVVNVISLHNHITGWVIETILNEENVTQRAAITSHFIAIANYCYQINNFSTMWAISSALNCASIYRLNATWALVSRKDLDIFSEINQIIQPTRNYSRYRDLLDRVNPPCVPFFGLYTKDLTFIEDGNSDSLWSDSRLINFAKRSLAADVLYEIRRFQFVPYNFVRVPSLFEFLDLHFKPRMSDEERYERSLKLEPRQSSSPYGGNYHRHDFTSYDMIPDEYFMKRLQENGFT